MPNHELIMWTFVMLADLARQRKQVSGCDRFLLLAGQAACQAGWLEVAERCREIVLRHNPHHLIGRYKSFPAALREPDFEPYLRNLERFCSYEHAELLLSELGIDPAQYAGECDYGERSLELLRGTGKSPAWEEMSAVA